MSLTPQWLDELRARITLSAVISRTTRLVKAGHEFKACCPFHNEKSPSFTVNDSKGFYHCLAGETVVITDSGRTPIAELAGKTATVLSRNGQWLPAKFSDYGRQQLWRIEVSRNRQRKVLFATSGHRWFVRNRNSAVTTEQLRKGQRLEPAFPLTRSDWQLDPAGVRHGIVFGDGSQTLEKYGHVHLHGAKDKALTCWFPDQKKQERMRDGTKPYVRIYGGLAFAGMKQLPPANSSEPYLLGFLAGYLAADGHVAKDGTVMLNSADPATLEAVRDFATKLGIGTFGRTTQRRRGLGKQDSALHRIHFVSSSLRPDFFMLAEARRRFEQSAKRFNRLRWQVVAVAPTDRNETVYCAEVPSEHAFAIEDNILTGNCFGCGAHGDAIRWMTDQRGLSFMDAVKELASEAGLEVPAPDPRAAAKAEQQAGLHDVLVAAQDWYRAQLETPEGAKAQAYLASRRFDAHTMERFGFGFAPGGRQALKSALKQFDEAMLIEAGLRIAVDDKEPYDRFRDRLTMPIHDARGRVIGFAARILDAEKKDAPKYINSPDTPLFDKGRTLFNLHRAGPASRQSGRIVVVEGQMDVIALAAAGIADAVAPMGTALTERQLEMLWRLVETPILCFDGDNAGQRAAMRAATRALPMLRPAHSLKIVRLPTGMDPDDLIKRDGVAALETLLAQPIGLLDLIWEHERAAAPLNTPEDKAGLKARLMAHVETIADPDIKAMYRRDLSDRFSAFAFPQREQRAWTPGKRGTPAPQRSDPAQTARLRRHSASRDALSAAVLAGLMRHPGELARHGDMLAGAELPDPRFTALIDAMDDGETLETTHLGTILAARGLAAPAPEEYAALRLSFLTPGAPDDQARAELASAVGLLVERPALEKALAQATERFERDLSEGSYAEQQRLLKRKLEFDSRLRQMANARAGASGEAPAKPMAE